MKVETQGSIGAENVLHDNDVRTADGVIVAADKDVDLSRFVGKRVLTVGVAEGFHHPERLIHRVRSTLVHTAGGGGCRVGLAGRYEGQTGVHVAVLEAAAGEEHLRILALLSRKLMDADFRERLTAAGDEDAVLRVLGEIR
jgi:PTS system fructose-specific IIC component